MRTFPLTVSSPDGDRFCGDVRRLSLRGTEGELAVMAGHVPFATAVRPCDCRWEDGEGIERSARIDGGILTVAQDRVLLLVGDFLWLDGEPL